MWAACTRAAPVRGARHRLSNSHCLTGSLVSVRRAYSFLSPSAEAFNKAVLAYVGLKHRSPELADIPAPYSTAELAHVCANVHSVTQATYAVAEDRLLEALQTLAAGTHASDSEAAVTRKLLLNGVADLAASAGYTPLSRQDAHLALTSHVRVPLPVRVAWEQLQSHLMADVGSSVYSGGGAAGVCVDPPPFADKLLVYHRGCGVAVEKGLFYNDKAEELFRRLARGAGHVARMPWRFIRSRVAHVFSSEPAPAPALHLSASIATAGSSLTGVQSPAANAHTHACTASHAGLCTHYKDIASVPRYPLSGIDLSLKSLLGSITIQDATFQSVVMLHFSVQKDPLAEKVAHTWHQWLENSESKATAVAVLSRRVWFVIRAVSAQWAAHNRKKSLSGHNEPFDLSWDDVEDEWEQSARVVWGSSLATATDSASSSNTNAASTHSSSIVSRHPLLRTTDHDHWEAQAEALSEAQGGGADESDAWANRLTSVLNLRELRDVPLSEMLLNFPAASIKMKPLDVAKLYGYVVAGISVLQATALGTSLSTYGTMLALSTVVALALRVFYRYQVARLYCEHRATQRATEQSYSRGGATLSSLVHDASVLDTRAAIVVLAALISTPNAAFATNTHLPCIAAATAGSGGGVSGGAAATGLGIAPAAGGAVDTAAPYGGLPLSELKRAVEAVSTWLVQELQLEHTHGLVDVPRAISTLRQLGIVQPVAVVSGTEPVYCVVAPAAAMAATEAAWGVLLKEPRV